MNEQAVRIQPVEPEPPKLRVLIVQVVARFASIAFLGGLFLMLGVNTAHDLYPVIAAVDYWQAVWLTLGLYMVGGAFKRTPWKWAAR
jgi:hypothetical protein